MKTIASAELFAERPGEPRFPLRIEIGPPYRDVIARDLWRCPVRIAPLHPRLPDIAGADAFQALCLATRLVVTLLGEFKKSGARLLNDDGSDFPLEAYMADN